MSLAVHIAAVSSHTARGAAVPGARGKTEPAGSGINSNTAHSSAGVSGQDFAAQFCEQAGVAEPGIAADALVDGKKGVGEDIAGIAPERESRMLAEANANGQSAQIAEDEAGMSIPKNAAVSNLPQASLAAGLKNGLSSLESASAAGREAAATDGGAEAISGGKPGEKPGEKRGGGKVAESSSAKRGAKTKAESLGNGRQDATGASGSLSVMGVAAAPVMGPGAPMNLGDAATKGNANPAPAGAHASAQDTANAPGNHGAAAKASAALQGSTTPGNTTPGSTTAGGNVGAQGASDSAANDSAAGLKGFGDAVKASTASAASAQHSSLTHPAASETLAPAVAAAPAMAHGSEAANPVQRMAQPAQIAASTAAPVAGATPVAAGNAYDRMDQGMAPVLLHSGAQHVSVGVQDPNLGWVEIKTQNIGGHVDATLVTASGQSHDTLATQLPAMAQFLEQRDVHVGALAVHHEMPGGQSGFAGSGAGNGSGNGSGNGANYGSGTGYSGQAGSGLGQGARQGSGESRPAPAVISSRPSRIAAMPVGVGANEDAVLRPMSYISVRA